VPLEPDELIEIPVVADRVPLSVDPPTNAPGGPVSLDAGFVRTGEANECKCPGSVILCVWLTTMAFALPPVAATA
jgi:hypothetical protein